MDAINKVLDLLLLFGVALVLGSQFFLDTAEQRHHADTIAILLIALKEMGKCNQK